MKELLNLLNSIYPLTPALQQHLSNTLKAYTAAKKEFILRPGHISRHIYYIQKGLVRCYHIEKGQEICSKFSKEGDLLVSATSFFLQKESHEYLQAIEDTIAWELEFDQLQHIYQYFIEFNFIGRVLATRCYLRSEQRLYLMRMKQAPDRYDSMLRLFPELVLRVPSKFIASYLGISEETLSRIRSRKY